METKTITRPLPACLARADKKIAALSSNILPEVPHLLSVPTQFPFRPTFPHENQNTPFNEREVGKLQYMTLMSDALRGVGLARGNWQDEIDGSPFSAGARSSTGTPNPFKDLKKPSMKMSISDYKNFKQTGAKPSPKPVTATPEPRHGQDAERKSGHERNVSTAAASTPMSRDSSLEGPEVRINGVKAIGAGEQKAVRKDERPALSQPTRDGDKARPVANGVVDNLASKPKQLARPAERLQSKENMQHKLPPRPQSPRHNILDNKTQKRPREQESLQPEKRAKIDRSKSPLLSEKPVRKPDAAVNSKPSPKPLQAANGASRPERRPEPKPAKSTEKPLNNLPPILSPLPADLTSPARKPESSGFDTVRKPLKENVTPKTPLKSKNNANGQKSTSQLDSPYSSPLSSPPDFNFPERLSPTLPDIIEDALAKLQRSAEKDKSTPLGVEARHEKARLPDTPGVARKMPRPKVGHPPKRRSDESSSSIRSRDPSRSRAPAEKPSMVVKLTYKKQQAKTVKNLLKLKPLKSKEFKKLEAERLAQVEGSIIVTPPVKAQTSAQVSDTEEDVPLSVTKTSAKKRPHDDRTPEPAPKRAKVPQNIDVPKSSTPLMSAFKSPAAAPTPQNLLATPKKGDAMKSAAMRRVDSNDSHHAQTPQTNVTSTPASVEKSSRTNGDHHNTVEMESFNRAWHKYEDLAKSLKHSMDNVFKVQLPAASTADKKKLHDLGICIGIETIVLFLVSFQAQGRYNRLKGRPIPEMWGSIIPFWTYVDKMAYGQDRVLAVVLANLGALSHEMLGKELNKSMKQGSKDLKLLESLVHKIPNADEERSNLWLRAHNGRDAVEQLMGKEEKYAELGPWCFRDMKEAARWTMRILEKFESREKGGWAKEVDF